MLFVAILVGLLVEGSISVFGLSDGGRRPRLGLVSGGGSGFVGKCHHLRINFLIQVTVFISMIWPKLIIVTSAHGEWLSSAAFNWSAGEIFLFLHRFAESRFGMASLGSI